MTGPIYRQVADDLRRKIESGKLAEGDQLDTEDELMEAYRTSRSTIRAALRELTTRGLVHTLHGKGTFVNQQVSPIVTTLTSDPKTGGGGGEGLVYTAEVAASGRSATTGRLRLEIMNANPDIAHSLGIPEGSGVICRHENRYVDDKPWSLQTSYYPWSLYHQAPELLNRTAMAGGTVAYLAECGIQQAGYRDRISVRVPNMEETDYFDLPADGHIQVVEICRVAFDQEQRRVRLTITVYPADRNQFVINVGDVPVSDELAVGGLEESSAGASPAARWRAGVTFSLGRTLEWRWPETGEGLHPASGSSVLTCGASHSDESDQLSEHIHPVSAIQAANPIEPAPSSQAARLTHFLGSSDFSFSGTLDTAPEELVRRAGTPNGTGRVSAVSRAVRTPGGDKGGVLNVDFPCGGTPRRNHGRRTMRPVPPSGGGGRHRPEAQADAASARQHPGRTQSGNSGPVRRAGQPSGT